MSWSDVVCKPVAPDRCRKTPVSKIIGSALMLLSVLPCAAPARAATLDSLVSQSAIIFKGRVRQIRAATMPIIPVSDSTVIVRVTEVLQAPPELGNFAGKDLTVIVADSGAVGPGEVAVFFTNGWLFGESIAVVDVGRIGAADTTNLHERVAAANLRLSTQRLKSRIDSAALVVVGKVTEAHPSSQTSLRERSEHDPDWWEAIVRIESVEKGKSREGSVSFLYPNSRDMAWYRVRKFGIGDSGIWLLHREALDQLDVSTLTALDSLDFQPKSRLDRLRRLIRGR